MDDTLLLSPASSSVAELLIVNRQLRDGLASLSARLDQVEAENCELRRAVAELRCEGQAPACRERQLRPAITNDRRSSARGRAFKTRCVLRSSQTRYCPFHALFLDHIDELIKNVFVHLVWHRSPPMSQRVAVIGSTGKGGYGHGLDTAFIGVEGAAVVAVADDNPAGLAAAGKLLKVDKLYADYHQLLETERPDIVCLGPRWLTDRVPMIETIAAAGCHLYCEKPLVADLVSLDAISAACQTHHVQLAMAHQWRAMPPVQQALAQLKAGRWGRPLRLRARAKDDARGGGEELIVHGTHWFDLMIAIAGRPEWVFGQVTVQGRDATRADVHQATEPVGPIAGDSISAMFGFAHGVRGGFETTAGLYRGK